MNKIFIYTDSRGNTHDATIIRSYDDYFDLDMLNDASVFLKVRKSSVKPKTTKGE